MLVSLKLNENINNSLPTQEISFNAQDPVFNFNLFVSLMTQCGIECVQLTAWMWGCPRPQLHIIMEWKFRKCLNYSRHYTYNTRKEPNLGEMPAPANPGLLEGPQGVLSNRRLPRSQATSERIANVLSYMYFHRFILAHSGKEISKRLQLLNFIPFLPQYWHFWRLKYDAVQPIP